MKNNSSSSSLLPAKSQSQIRKESAIKIQSIFRMLKAKSIYAMIYHRYLITQSSTKLQATFRMYKYKKKYEEHKSMLKDQLRLKSVIVIQKFCRNYLKLGTTKG